MGARWSPSGYDIPGISTWAWSKNGHTDAESFCRLTWRGSGAKLDVGKVHVVVVRTCRTLDYPVVVGVDQDCDWSAPKIIDEDIYYADFAFRKRIKSNSFFVAAKRTEDSFGVPAGEGLNELIGVVSRCDQSLSVEIERRIKSVFLSESLDGRCPLAQDDPGLACAGSDRADRGDEDANQDADHRDNGEQFDQSHTLTEVRLGNTWAQLVRQTQLRRRCFGARRHPARRILGIGGSVTAKWFCLSGRRWTCIHECPYGEAIIEARRIEGKKLGSGLTRGRWSPTETRGFVK